MPGCAVLLEAPESRLLSRQCHGMLQKAALAVQQAGCLRTSAAFRRQAAQASALTQEL